MAEDRVMKEEGEGEDNEEVESEDEDEAEEEEEETDSEFDDPEGYVDNVTDEGKYMYIAGTQHLYRTPSSPVVATLYMCLSISIALDSY